jgi:hypothetical protein
MRGSSYGKIIGSLLLVVGPGLSARAPPREAEDTLTFFDLTLLEPRGEEPSAERLGIDGHANVTDVEFPEPRAVE